MKGHAGADAKLYIQFIPDLSWGNITQAQYFYGSCHTLQPLMTPEENEAYLRKLNELQRYLPKLSYWIERLGRDVKRSDHFVKLKSLYNLLSNEQRRVPIATLIKCEVALMKMFDYQSKESQEQPMAGGQSQPPVSSVVAPPTGSASSSSPPVVASLTSSSSSVTSSPAVTTTTPSSLPPPTESVVSPTKLTDPRLCDRGRQIHDFHSHV